MDKPLSLKREDFLQRIIEAVNGSDLPPFVVLDIMKAVTEEVANLAKRQYEADKKTYEEAEKGASEDA